MTAVVAKLRPAKVRSAVSRRWFEWRLGNLPLEPGPPVVSLGSAYGGWRVPDPPVAADAVCYCVGSGNDVSFDLALIERYSAHIRAIEPVTAYRPTLERAAAADDRFRFRSAALAASDGPIRMQTHHEGQSSSLSAAGLYDSDQWSEVPGLTLASLMAGFGDDRIALLKIDVEGLEYELVPGLDLVALGVTVFSVQLHHTRPVSEARSLIAGIRGQGFRLVAQRPVVKLTFWRDPAHDSVTASAAS